MQGFGKLLWRRAEEQQGTATAPPRVGRAGNRAGRVGGRRAAALRESRDSSFPVGLSGHLVTFYFLKESHRISTLL